jgi:hypothetical protein
MKPSTSTPPTEPLAVFTTDKATDLNSYVSQLLSNVDLAIRCAEGKIAQLEAAEEAAAAAEINQDAVRSKENRSDAQAKEFDRGLEGSNADYSVALRARDTRERLDNMQESIRQFSEVFELRRSWIVAGRRVTSIFKFHMHMESDAVSVCSFSTAAGSYDKWQETDRTEARTLYKTLLKRGFVQY